MQNVLLNLEDVTSIGRQVDQVTPTAVGPFIGVHVGPGCRARCVTKGSCNRDWLDGVAGGYCLIDVILRDPSSLVKCSS